MADENLSDPGTMAYKTIEDTIGNTPLVRLQRIPALPSKRAAT
jgi:cysteine synthase B